MDSLASNPFSVLTFIVAPAILTNASSVMGMSTSNRIARVVDRSRVLASEIEKGALGEEEKPLRLRELAVLDQRARLLVAALSSFYLSVGSFAAASLVSLLGAVFVLVEFHLPSWATMVLGLLCGALGLGGLVRGATLLVLETRLALKILHETTLAWTILRKIDPPSV